jgi:hypothetical protein
MKLGVYFREIGESGTIYQTTLFQNHALSGSRRKISRVPEEKCKKERERKKRKALAQRGSNRIK